MNANATVVYHANPDGVWDARLTDTDELIYTAPSGWSIDGVSWDGSIAAIAAQPGAEEATSDDCGPTRLVSTVDGAVGAELSSTGCPGPVYFSPDDLLAYTTFDLDWGGLFDTSTGDLIAEFPSELLWYFAAFTPDGERLIVGVTELAVLDVPAVLSGVSPSEAVVNRIGVFEPVVATVVVSPDSTTVAASSNGTQLRLWDLRNGEFLEAFGDFDGGFHFADFYPDPSIRHLLVTTEPNEVRIYTLDIDELVEIAESRLTRAMTAAECDQYFRGPCP